MTRNISREEAYRIAAEKMRQKKEKEERENREFYERITSGWQWLIFKIVVVFCTAMMLVTVIETFVDGPSKKISEEDWKINREWEWAWHQIIEVEGYLFAPELVDWLDHKENTLQITYSPIFHTGKKLSFTVQENEFQFRRHEEVRFRSIFNWFPTLQIFLLIPLITLIFKRQSPWFNFARIASLVFVFPGTLLIIYFSMY